MPAPSFVPTSQGSPVPVWADYVNGNYWAQAIVPAMVQDDPYLIALGGIVSPVPSYAFNSGGLYAQAVNPAPCMTNPAIVQLNQLIAANNGFSAVVTMSWPPLNVSRIYWSLFANSRTAYQQIAALFNEAGGTYNATLTWNDIPESETLTIQNSASPSLPMPTGGIVVWGITVLGTTLSLWINGAFVGQVSTTRPLLPGVIGVALAYRYNPATGGPNIGTPGLGSVSSVAFMAPVANPTLGTALSVGTPPNPLQLPPPQTTPLPCIPCCRTAAPLICNSAQRILPL